MRRLGLGLGRYAGLGLAAAVVAAWLIALFAGPVEFDPQLTAKLRRADFAAADRGHPRPWLDSAWRAGGLQVLVRHSDRSYAVRAGWPLPAFRGTSVGDTDPAGGHHVAAFGLGADVKQVFRDRTKVSVRGSVPRLLPFAPIWAGLVFDALVFAVPAALAIHGSRAARRLWRLRCGRCSHCGFDLRGGAPGCPECGWRRPRGEVISA